MTKNFISVNSVFKKLDALTKNFLGTTEDLENTPSLAILKKERPGNYNPYMTTLKMQRKLYCAKIVIRTMQKYVHAKKLNDQLQNQKKVRQATFDESD